MITSERIQPAFEICNLMYPQLFDKLLEDLHDCIFRFSFIAKVFKTQTENQRHIVSIQFPKNFQITTLMVFKQNCLFIIKISAGSFLNKSQFLFIKSRTDRYSSSSSFSIRNINNYHSLIYSEDARPSQIPYFLSPYLKEKIIKLIYMKLNKFLAALSIVLFPFCVTVKAQVNIGNMLKKAIAGTPPSADEMSQGLKEALSLGVSSGSDRLSALDGFMGDNAIKILFPPQAQKAEKTLRGLGMNKLCDDLILSLNRAAEDAAKEAKPIFMTAIKEMSIRDASNILLSRQQDAATQYFKTVTYSQLRDKFKPIIQASLEKAGASGHWTDVTSNYNKVPLVTKVNTDLSDYTTQKAIEGLFVEIAKEELKLRGNTFSRSSALLQKVFGYADKNN